MNLEYRTFVEVQEQLAAFFADPGDEEQAALKAREDYYRNWIAERPKPETQKTPEPAPIEKPKYRKPDRSKWKNSPRGEELQEILSLVSKSKAFSAGDLPSYTVDDRVIEAAEAWHDNLCIDARDMEWDGYEWIEL